MTHACAVRWLWRTCGRDLKFPNAPMGKLLTRLPRLSLAQLRLTLRSTTVCTCRRGLNFSHRPDGKVADVLAPTHACTTANASVNYSRYVLQRPCKVPIAPMGKLLTCSPRLSLAQLWLTLWSTTASMFCSGPQIFPTPRWETHACSAYCLQGGGVFVYGGTVTISSCTISGNAASVRAHLQKFPSPDGNIADVLALTLACTTANASVNFRRCVPQRP